MGRKLFDMNELEQGVVLVVIAAVVHYTKLVRIARERSLLILTMGFCCFISFPSTNFCYLRHYIVIFLHFDVYIVIFLYFDACHFYLF